MKEMKTLTLGGQTFKVVDEDAVRVTEQSLSHEQKVQTRKNIGITTGIDTLSWDGNTSGKTMVFFDNSNGGKDPLVRVSDVILTRSDIPDEGSYQIIYDMSYGDIRYPITPESITVYTNGVIILGQDIISVPNEAVGKQVVFGEGFVGVSTGTFNEPGIYFYHDDGYHTARSLTIPGYTGFGPEKIDPNLLPTSAVTTAQVARIGEIAIFANNWVGDTSPYSQIVTVDGVTPNSQVDLTPSVEQLSTFYHKDLAFVTENEDGVVTVYAIGQKPEHDYTIQVTITEVAI